MVNIQLYAMQKMVKKLEIRKLNVVCGLVLNLLLMLEILIVKMLIEMMFVWNLKLTCTKMNMMD